MTFDLHCHSLASDGSLAPKALVDHAAECGVTTLSITDHDTVAAYAALGRSANLPLRLVPGVEFSARWRNRGVHVVGLNIDLDSTILAAGVARQRRARIRRGVEIAERLSRAGLGETLEGANRLAGDAAVGRVHFARQLVIDGRVPTMRDAFRKYLGDGKLGDVKHEWPALDTVTRWILDSSGIAVLAHPARYKLTATRLGMLVEDFRRGGGRAIEVVSGNQTLDVTRRLASLCVESGLLASCGSDFHQPQCRWSRPGKFPALPSVCQPVWLDWSD